MTVSGDDVFDIMLEDVQLQRDMVKSNALRRRVTVALGKYLRTSKKPQPSLVRALRKLLSFEYDLQQEAKRSRRREHEGRATTRDLVILLAASRKRP
jgi:hypothetical protein